jgi:hypothetical protein
MMSKQQLLLKFVMLCKNHLHELYIKCYPVLFSRDHLHIQKKLYEITSLDVGYSVGYSAIARIWIEAGYQISVAY